GPSRQQAEITMTAVGHGNRAVPLASDRSRFRNEPERILWDLLRYLHHRLSDLSQFADQSRGPFYLSSGFRIADLANLPARADRKLRFWLVHRADLRPSVQLFCPSASLMGSGRGGGD